jgi:predicted transcriptional regulator
MSEETTLSPVELAAELTIAWLGNQNNRVTAEEVPLFLRTMHTTINELSNNSVPASEEDASNNGENAHQPAVSVRKSLASRDHILSMIDGKPYRTLKRHLSRHGLTPEQYRERYNLKPDYPMVAETYSEERRAMAHKIGLGAKGRQARAEANRTTDAAKPAGRGRRKATTAE